MSAAEQKRSQALRLIKELSTPTNKTHLSQSQSESQAFNIRRLLENFDFFQELAPAVRERLPSICHLHSNRKQGEVLFQQGEAPDRCYILLSGSVSVWKKDETSDVTGIPFSRRPSVQQTILSRRCSEADIRCTLAADAEETDQPTCTSSALDRLRLRRSPSKTGLAGVAADVCKEQKQRRRSGAWKRIDVEQVLALQEPPSPWGDKIATLNAGELFGELALLEDKLRSATIVCEEDCDFLVIERGNFETVLKSEMTRNRDDRLKLMREHLPGFRGLPEHKMNKAYYPFRKRTFSKGHVFVSQGDCAKPMAFLVVEGTVEVRHARERVGGFGKQDIQVVSTIMQGALFGSVQQSVDEPFTVVAKTRCDVLCVSGRGLKSLPLSLSQRMHEYLSQVNQEHSERCTSSLQPNMPNAFALSTNTNTSPMMKQTAKRMRRSSSGTRQAVPTATADQTALVTSGTLRALDLLSALKREASPCSRPRTKSRAEPIRSDGKSLLSSPASTRLPSRETSRPTTPGSVSSRSGSVSSLFGASTPLSIRSRSNSVTSLLNSSASTAGSACSPPSSAKFVLPAVNDPRQTSCRPTKAGNMNRSISESAMPRLQV